MWKSHQWVWGQGFIFLQRAPAKGLCFSVPSGCWNWEPHSPTVSWAPPSREALWPGCAFPVCGLFSTKTHVTTTTLTNLAKPTWQAFICPSVYSLLKWGSILNKMSGTLHTQNIVAWKYSPYASQFQKCSLKHHNKWRQNEYHWSKLSHSEIRE